jgi:hypothetical protein
MKRRFALVLLAGLVPLLVVCSNANYQHASGARDPRLQTFARQKRQQTEELAAKLHCDVSPKVRGFFQATEAGDWDAIARYQAVYRRSETSHGGAFLGLQNAMFTPVQDALGAYWSFSYWDDTVLQKFADGILQSTTPGSIYFGGTDPGRFIITAVRDTAQSPDIFILTQNGLAESRYMDYLRLTYGDRLSLPSTNEVQAAFR